MVTPIAAPTAPNATAIKTHMMIHIRLFFNNVAFRFSALI
jgi:hypothetical protein